MASELARDLWTLRAAVSLAELTRRYRRLCKLYHPDLQEPGLREQCARQMQDINAAYAESLKRFNIITYQPARASATPAAAQPAPRRETSRPADAAAEQERIRQNVRAAAASSGAGHRQLSAALATLKLTRTFFSLHGTDDPAEQALYQRAIDELREVWRRFPGSTEAQDALYYMAIAHCNLKAYDLALQGFTYYRKLYPQDPRSELFHFYAGLCYHRLGSFAAALEEYGAFLLAQGGSQYKHFAALVASYMDAARQQSIPHALPYG
jgi:TolA-binding protein